MKRALLALVACQLALDARLLLFAAVFRWLPAEVRDGPSALRSILTALAEDGDPA